MWTNALYDPIIQSKRLFMRDWVMWRLFFYYYNLFKLFQGIPKTEESMDYINIGRLMNRHAKAGNLLIKKE